MIKLIITEVEKSNKPVAILSLETEAAVFDFWIAKMIDNPEKYQVEVYVKYTFSEKCAETWHNVFGALCLAYEMRNGSIKDVEIKSAIFGTFQGFAFAEEILKNFETEGD